MAKDTGDFAHHYYQDLSDAWHLFLLYRQAYDLSRTVKKSGMITQEMESRIADLTTALYEAVLATTESPTRLMELRSSWEAVEGHLRSLVEALAEERTS